MCGEPPGLAGQGVRLMCRTRGSMPPRCHRHEFSPKRSMKKMPQKKYGLTFIKRYLIFVLVLALLVAFRPSSRNFSGSFRNGLGLRPRRHRIFPDVKDHKKRWGDRMAHDHEIRIRIPEEHYRTLLEMATLRRVSLSGLAREIIGERLSGKRSFEERVLTELQNISHPKSNPKEGERD